MGGALVSGEGGTQLASINLLRAILVGGAALAALIAAVYGRWTVVVILLLAIVAHGFLWIYLHRQAAPPSDALGRPADQPPED